MANYKRIENLNFAPFRKGTIQRGTRKEMDFHFRGGVKIEGKENKMRECKECHKILPSISFNTHVLRSNGAFSLLGLCRECHTIIDAEHRGARKKATPKPDHCECCHREKKLQVDHLHGSTTFRGWLCRDCNTGMGSLGDNLEGMLQAAIYLKNDKDKIIETLHKVFNEMFARTTEEK